MKAAPEFVLSPETTKKDERISPERPGLQRGQNVIGGDMTDRM